MPKLAILAMRATGTPADSMRKRKSVVILFTSSVIMSSETGSVTTNAMAYVMSKIARQRVTYLRR